MVLEEEIVESVRSTMVGLVEGGVVNSLSKSMVITWEEIVQVAGEDKQYKEVVDVLQKCRWWPEGTSCI